MDAWGNYLSFRIAYLALAVAIVLTLTCFVVEMRRRSFRWLAVYAALLALQPLWHVLTWEELRSGFFPVRADCGYGPRSLSLLFLAVTIAAFLVVWRRPSFGRRAFVFRVCLVFTLVSVFQLMTDFLPIFSWIGSHVVWDVYMSIFGALGGTAVDILIYTAICVVLYTVQRFAVASSSLARRCS